MSTPPISRNRLTKLSKRCSYLLRHKPEAGDIVLDDEGWTSVADLLASIGAAEEELVAVVAQNDKNRFELDLAAGRIRARQGHSVSVDLGLTPVTPPRILFHGTVTEALPAIFTEGLRPMSRQFVHLSASTAVAEDVAGRRRRGEPIILIIDGEALVQAGLEVFESTNGVFLTSHVPVDCIRMPDGA